VPGHEGVGVVEAVGPKVGAGALRYTTLAVLALDWRGGGGEAQGVLVRLRYGLDWFALCLSKSCTGQCSGGTRGCKHAPQHAPAHTHAFCSSLA
jgi:hypothetical protein